MQQQQFQRQHVVTNQPGVAFVKTGQPISIGKQPLRDWNSGICGCAEDCESCCCTLFFSWCYMCCCLSERMGEHCCTPIIAPNPVMLYRLKLRTKYNIEGSIICDCCHSYFCGLCSICQLARELNYIESQNGGPAFYSD